MKNQFGVKIFLMELYYWLLLIATIIVYPFIILFAVLMKLKKFVRNKSRSKSIRGQVAVITGSARGLGRILAIELAKRGCHVAIVDVLQDLAEKTALHIAQNYQVKAKSYKVDVSNYRELEELNKSVTRDLGDITILINNAGILTPACTECSSPEDIQRMINVNFTALCFTKKIFLPKMKSLNIGHIVNISSASALYTLDLLDVYGATKAAVRSITSAFRMEIMAAKKNITVTTVMPMFLTTNQEIVDLVNVAGFQKLFPIVNEEISGQYIVDGMLNGEEELTIPNAVLYLYKLHELLPICIKEVLSTFLRPKDVSTILKLQQQGN